MQAEYSDTYWYPRNYGKLSFALSKLNLEQRGLVECLMDHYLVFRSIPADLDPAILADMLSLPLEAVRSAWNSQTEQSWNFCRQYLDSLQSGRTSEALAKPKKPRQRKQALDRSAALEILGDSCIGVYDAFATAWGHKMEAFGEPEAQLIIQLVQSGRSPETLTDHVIRTAKKFKLSERQYMPSIGKFLEETLSKPIRHKRTES